MAGVGDHGERMDAVYRNQRHFYDLTRKYYLFGRDGLIDGLAVAPGGTVLEIGCGTGRNLARIAARWPGARLHGLDISDEMLRTARSSLGGRAVLAPGDAAGFDAAGAFGRARFDRVVISYALSMIPDWIAALRQAGLLLEPGGSLHVVDFGDCAGLPGPVRRALVAWLARFHVTPRLRMGEVAASLAGELGLACEARNGPLDYYQAVTLTRA